MLSKVAAVTSLPLHPLIDLQGKSFHRGEGLLWCGFFCFITKNTTDPDYIKIQDYIKYKNYK